MSYKRGLAGAMRAGAGILLLALAMGCDRKERVDPTEATLADFTRRVDEYLTLRTHLADSVTPLDDTRSQEEITTRAASLGQAIIARRATAKQGDIFTPEIAAVIATLIKEEYSRRPAPVQDTRDDQQDELPDFTPTVNQIYPTTYPLATFPASLLPILPRLPDKVEYRVVSHYLILRDVEANLILDVMPNAVP